MEVDLSIEGAQSLKDKRQVIRSLLDTIRNKLNVSAAEVDHHDVWRTATLGFAAVANDCAFLNQVIDRVIGFIDAEPRCEIVSIDRQVQ